MKHNNKGFSLMELISAIAILSIVAIAAFTLLMFSINSNNMILAGASASQDAELLNKRLKLLFADQHIYLEIADTEELEEVIFYEKVTVQDEETYPETGKKLILSNGKLTYGDEASAELLQENLSDFSISSVNGTSLIKISYSIGDHHFTKLFRVNFVPKPDNESQKTP
jgi:prepilin-type N-terminal cleavage/methylation domain-containing protein